MKASNADAGDSFGASLALSGDTLAVGAPNEESNAIGVGGDQGDNSGQSAGAVYVFQRNGALWTQQAYIKASNTDETSADDRFGASVALSGETLAVGAPDEDSNATGVNGDQDDESTSSAGAVYVFTRSGTVWTQQSYIKASNPEILDGFGSNVAIFDDTLAVSATSEDSSSTGVNGNQADNEASASGAVYVFTRSGTSWSQEAYLKASNPDENDRFGGGLSLSGNTLAVGAGGEDSSATGIDGAQNANDAASAGAVYVFTRSGTSWSQQAYIKASNTDPDDRFGDSVALSGDGLVVGASNEASAATGVNGNQDDNTALNAGAAYFFTRSEGQWSQQAYVKSSNAEGALGGSEGGDTFGRVALSEDTLAVGANFESSSATGIDGDQTDNTADGAGAVYMFQ
jgi:hypothetical protein